MKRRRRNVGRHRNGNDAARPVQGARALPREGQCESAQFIILFRLFLDGQHTPTTLCTRVAQYSAQSLCAEFWRFHCFSTLRSRWSSQMIGILNFRSKLRGTFGRDCAERFVATLCGAFSWKFYADSNLIGIYSNAQIELILPIYAERQRSRGIILFDIARNASRDCHVNQVD